MTSKSWDANALVSYLLGEMEEERAAELEEAYFADSALFERMNTQEAELLHAYLRGELSAAQRDAVERAYASGTERGKRLAEEREWFEAAQLARQARREPKPRWIGLFGAGGWAARVPALAGALALLIVISAAGWIAWRSARQERPSLTARAEPVHQKDAPAVAAFLLEPGLTRGEGGMRRLRIAPEVGLVRLELDVRGVQAAPPYSATLQTTGGTETWSGAAVATRYGARLELRPEALSANDYVLTLCGDVAHSGTSVIARYYFSTSK